MRFYQTVERWITTKGKLTTIARLKDIRTQFYSASVGLKLELKGYRTFKSGLPHVFGHELDAAFRERDPRALRLILTLVQVSRSIDAWKKVDLSTITSPSTAKLEVIEEFKASMPKLLERLPLQSERPVWEKLHIATTMGPIGPAMTTNATLIDKFLTRFSHLAQELQFEGLVTYLESVRSLSSIWESIYPSRMVGANLPLRRLSTVPDVDGKNRVIGIIDYWSQSILKPLHKDLMATLESLGGPRGPDLTFGQDIKAFGPSTEPYYSLDLTAATDRFPIFLQEKLLSKIFDENLSSN
jgi:hypothetical protein